MAMGVGIPAACIPMLALLADEPAAVCKAAAERPELELGSLGEILFDLGLSLQSQDAGPLAPHSTGRETG